MHTNLILWTDSYKLSHFLQYPPNMSIASDYIEARAGGRWSTTTFFGLQIALIESFTTPITQKDIEEAASLVSRHGLPFNRDGFEYILDEYNGFLPLEIQAVPEGLTIPTGNVLVQFRNTDEKCAWLTSYMETAMLQSVWYPTTVCTNSIMCKRICFEYLQSTGCTTIEDVLPFQIHDFGFRGASSRSSAGIGGAAHLVNSFGTDNIAALESIAKYYSDGLPSEFIGGFSIPASEHSTIISWGEDYEVDAFSNMLHQFLKPDSVVACVSDSYDMMNACRLWGTIFKERIETSGGRLVVRPDSGDPIEMSVAVVSKLAEYFKPVTNAAGYKVLPDCIRVIYGDGIDEDSIRGILSALKVNGFAAENINFGMGGALLQGVNRDTLRFACKLNEVKIGGNLYDVCKHPISSDFKSSKPGRLALITRSDGTYRTIRERDLGRQDNVLRTVFENGKLLIRENIEQIRERAGLEFI